MDRPLMAALMGGCGVDADGRAEAKPRKPPLLHGELLLLLLLLLLLEGDGDDDDVLAVGCSREALSPLLFRELERIMPPRPARGEMGADTSCSGSSCGGGGREREIVSRE